MPSRKDDRRDLVETLARSIRRDRGSFGAALARRDAAEAATPPEPKPEAEPPG